MRVHCRTVVPRKANMREMTIFCKERIGECEELARHSSNPMDETFWREAAQRWAVILRQYEKPAAANSMNSRANTRRIGGPRKAAA